MTVAFYPIRGIAYGSDYRYFCSDENDYMYDTKDFDLYMPDNIGFNI